MNLTEPPSGVLDPQQPYWPADKVGQQTWLRLKAKLTGRPIAEMSGERHTSYVKLGDADADRLIENIKKYGQYPQVNQNDKYGGAYNAEAYQKWLVEEFLEKPFREQTNQKIEQAAINSRLKEIQEQKKQRAQSFISQSSILKPGKKISVKVNRISGIIPKRSIPTDVATKITPKDSEDLTTTGQGSDAESVASPSRKVVSSLGRLTLDLVQINDNLDAIKDVIAEDYAQTKETNKREIEEYRKRIANRQRKLPKKDLGDNKNSLKDIIKPFVGSFFSGVGGAIRALAAFNLMDALLNGDYMQVFKSLMGIGITFIPQIGTMIAGAVLKSLLKGFGRGMVGGGGGRLPMGRPGRMRGSPGIGKFGAMMALGTGALALGSAFASSQDTGGEDQSRLEEVTAEQKALTADGIGAITQEDLKKFQNLNEKFDRAIELLLMKPTRQNGGAGAGGGASSAGAPDVSTQGVEPIGPVAANQDAAYKMVYDAAVKAGSPDPSMTASIAMLESGWLNPNLTQSRYNQSGGTNPFGQTGTGTKGSVNGFAVYNSLEEGVAEHVRLWGSYYGTTPEETVRKMRDAGYNQEGGGGPWMRKVLSIQKGMTRSDPPARPAAPRRTGDEVSSATPSSRGVLVSLAPAPVGSGGPGSATNNGTVGDDYVDPNNREDTVGMLYRTQMNIMEVG